MRESPRELWRRLASLRRRSEIESGIDEEIRFHIDQQTQKNLRAGMPPEQARRAALLAFGGVSRVKEEVRDEVRPRLLEDLAHDLRYAVRVLRKAPVFTLVAALTIGIGIGATTAIFSVVQRVLLTPLPYPGADRLVVPQTLSLEDGATWAVSYVDFREWEAAGVFSSAALYQQTQWNVTGSAEAERLEGATVTPGFFSTLGTAPALGRYPRPEEFVPNTPRVVVLSYETWQGRFGGDRAIVGRVLTIGGYPREVIGVASREADFPSGAQLWAPYRVDPSDMADLERADNYVFSAIARLKPGKSLAQTRSEMAALAERVGRENPRTRQNVSVTAQPLLEWTVGDELPRSLWLFLGAVGMVLLIGCLNVANLLLGRAAGRGREFAVRGALGARRGRLVRQLLTESLALALVGGAIGVLLAYWGVTLLVRLAPEGTPRLEDVSLDPLALGFAVAVSFASALLFGLAPALTLAGEGIATPLGEEDRRSTTGKRGRRARRLLAVAEIALSLVLLVGAGLLLKSLSRLSAVDPGFDVRDVVTVSLALQGERYQSDEAREGTFREIVAGARALPGVSSAAAVSALPLGGGGFYLGRAFLAEGQPEPPAGPDVMGQWSLVTPGYLGTMGISLLQGRDFTSADRRDGAPVMIVSREFVRRAFPDGQAVGKRVRSWRDENLYREVVGVVDDVRYFGAGDEIQPLVYVPHAQTPWSEMVLTVRARGDAEPVLRSVRSLVARVDPSLAVGEVQRMEQVMAQSLAPRRFGALLLAAFAVIALLLASIGTYGVLAYTVAQRTREFGIRMALGARAREITRMVVREGAGVALQGVAVGVAGALLLTRGMSSLLYEVRTTDAATYAGVALLLSVVALAACWIPARRASRVDPAEAIRRE